jgi:hypothetical protein
LSLTAVWAHDHRFIRLCDEVLSEAQFPSSWWERYLGSFTDLVVLAREGALPNDKLPRQLNVSSHAKVSFVGMANLSSVGGQVFYRRRSLEAMRNAVRAADAVIARLPSEIGLLAVEVACAIGRPFAIELAGCPWDGSGLVNYCVRDA